MDYGAAFSFLGKDTDWLKKMAIASGVALVGFVTLGLAMIPLGGWAVAISRRVIRGEQPELAEWSDFGKLIVDGLKIVVVVLVWMIPLLILVGCNVGFTAIMGGQGSSNSGGLAISIVSACLGLIEFVYVLIVSVLVTASMGEIADHGQLGQALNPANAFALIRANPGGYLLAWLLGGIASSILSTIGSLICVIGVFPAVAYAAAITGHLYGQAYKVAQTQGAAG